MRISLSKMLCCNTSLICEEPKFHGRTVSVNGEHRSMLATSYVACKLGPLQVDDFTILCREFKKAGMPTRHVEWNVHYLVGPFVDRPHVLVGTWRHIAIFSAFKGEGWHKALKTDISTRNFRGVAKGGRVSRLRGTRRAKAGMGKRKWTGWGEVIRSDNLD